MFTFAVASALGALAFAAQLCKPFTPSLNSKCLHSYTRTFRLPCSHIFCELSIYKACNDQYDDYVLKNPHALLEFDIRQYIGREPNLRDPADFAIALDAYARWKSFRRDPILPCPICKTPIKSVPTRCLALSSFVEEFGIQEEESAQESNDVEEDLKPDAWDGWFKRKPEYELRLNRFTVLLTDAM